jgi:MFS transporter, VNT family, synaptic vesicle glycoprotein 2
VGALKILNRIYLINNPDDSNSYNVIKLTNEHEFLDEVFDEDSSNPLQLLWSQTRTLFSADHVRKTLLVCVVQFLMYASCHGLYMFFPEIVDKVESHSKLFPDNSSTICEIVETTIEVLLDSAENSTCNENIEVATFGYALILELLYMLGFLLITLVINRTTKLSILLTILVGCGASGVGTLFSKIPLLSISLYIAFMLTFLGVNIVCAATCNLYPTKLRGMAVNISLMFGRMGSVASTFIIGRTLNDFCSSSFGVSAALMLLSGFLSIFIPRIREIEGRK